MRATDIKKKLSPLFERCGEVGIVYLFGSQATGAARPSSDYDLAVYFTLPDPVQRSEKLFELSGAVSKVLDRDAVDMHSLNDLYAPELRYHILRDGVVIFEREPYRVLIEPRILNEYFDFTYLLRKYGLTKA